MSTENNQTLRLSLAAFVAILIHTAIALSIHFLDISLIEIKEKSIPFKLVSANRSSQFSTSSPLSPTDNARAAQEYLATLNQSQFKSTADNKSKHTGQGKRKSRQQSPITKTSKQAAQHNTAFQGSNPSTAISGLQNIFSRNSRPLDSSQVKQVSSKALEALSDYEILLLNTLAKDSLYDPFHEVMKANKHKEVSYTITLSLFPNGAIKNASIKQPSGLQKIDELAIQAAFRASPFPTPPRDDIQRGYKYDIPIIYQDKRVKDK